MQHCHLNILLFYLIMFVNWSDDNGYGPQSTKAWTLTVWVADVKDLEETHKLMALQRAGSCWQNTLYTSTSLVFFFSLSFVKIDANTTPDINSESSSRLLRSGSMQPLPGRGAHHSIGMRKYWSCCYMWLWLYGWTPWLIQGAPTGEIQGCNYPPRVPFFSSRVLDISGRYNPFRSS